MSARILVVDDIPVNVKLLSAKLSAEYYDVISAGDGPSALTCVETQAPDIVLLDVMMPGMSGFEVCRRIKADPKFTHIPVVMVTALDQPEDRIQGLEAGADDFLTKPVNDVALFARVRSLVRFKRVIDEWRTREETSQRLGVTSQSMTLADEPGDKAAVLVMDEGDQPLRRLEAALAPDNHRVTRAQTSAEALEHAAKGIDVAVVSLRLKSEDPLRLCSLFRSQEQTRHLPILMIADDGDKDRLVKGLELGANDYIVRPIDANEFRARVRTQVRRRRFQDHMRNTYEASLSLALTDALTGLYNRRYLQAYMEGLAKSASGQGKPISLVMVDVDHFKSINDTFGHAGGDEVLKAVAERLYQNVRGFDMVARYGGEEFVVVMPEATVEEAFSAAERLRVAIADQPMSVSTGGAQQTKTVTISLGVATGTHEELSDGLLRRADAALYQAKQSGRNRAMQG